MIFRQDKSYSYSPQLYSCLFSKWLKSTFNNQYMEWMDPYNIETINLWTWFVRLMHIYTFFAISYLTTCAHLHPPHNWALKAFESCTLRLSITQTTSFPLNLWNMDGIIVFVVVFLPIGLVAVYIQSLFPRLLATCVSIFHCGFCLITFHGIFWLRWLCYL